MNQRAEVFSSRFFSDNGSKTYFLNVKENRFDNLYLTLVESRKGKSGKFQRSSIQIFEEVLTPFYTAMNKMKSELSDVEKKGWSFTLDIEESQRIYEFTSILRYDDGSDLSIKEIHRNEEKRTSYNQIRLNLSDFSIFCEHLEKVYRYIIG